MATQGSIWRNGDLDKLKTNIKLRANDWENAAEDLVHDIVAEAAIDQALVIENAHTDTGRDRAANGGGSPGRVESGQMINAINSTVERQGRKIVGMWGWRDPEEYYRWQDDGTGKIEAAHSLLTSFIRAREKMIGRLVTLSRGKR